MTIIEEELKKLILQIREETKFGGNTKERVANTFDRLVQFVEEKFKNNKSESLTFLGTPTLVDNVFYLKYTNENGVEQTVSADLSGLTPDVVLPTKTSDFQNDGEDGTNPFITAQDIPAPIPQVNADWNATSGVAEILNKPTIPAPVDISTKAETDASNLSTSNVIRWRTALDIYSKSQVDTALTLKLDKPTTDGSWVVTKSGATYSYTDASNFGKNIGNSHITSIANSSFTLGANYTINTSGYYFNITNLPDKSADNTFIKLMVQNASGQVASVSNPYHILKSGLSLMTPEQGIELGQLFNGGSGSAGAMDVNLISPPIVQRIDSVEYILLRGTNLNLNAVSKKIEILNASTNAVVYTIPDEHIQLYNDGLSLVFQYNPKDLSVGSYKIRLTSGIKIYVTTLLLECVETILNIPLESITWSPLYATPESNLGSNVFQGANVNVRTPVGEATPSPVIAFKSSEIFAQGDDFYLEIRVSASLETDHIQPPPELNKSFFGLGYSSTVNSLNNNALIYYAYQYNRAEIGPQSVFGIWEFNNSVFVKKSPYTVGSTDTTVIFIKTGNLFRTIIDGVNSSITLSNNLGYSLYGSLVPRVKERSFTAQIVKAFKFN